MWPGRMVSSPAVRKMTRAPGRAVRAISVHKRRQLCIAHPVLRVEQNVCIVRFGARRLAARCSVRYVRRRW